MRLAEFICKNTPRIISEWEDFARSLIPAANTTTPLALRDHIQETLDFITSNMAEPQTRSEQKQKSHGEGAQRREQKPSAAETHAALRLAGGFNLDQMVSEYRALRASIIKLWKDDKEGDSKAENHSTDLQDMIRFNEAIDQALTESISHYTKKIAGSKNLFLGIIGHDLRNPLGAMLGSAQLIPQIGDLNQRQRVLVAQIIDSGARITEIISHLLDITRARFGSGLPVSRAHMDMGFIARQMVDEMRALYPDRKFVLEVSGDTEGEWDRARIGQVFSNLLGNAVQYSFQDTAIQIAIKGEPKDVVLSVHNQGVPIPPDQIGKVFDSLTRAYTKDNAQEDEEAMNLGLGLYITKEIVSAHGGTLDVTSSAKNGTIFTARFPRLQAAPDEKEPGPLLGMSAA